MTTLKPTANAKTTATFNKICFARCGALSSSLSAGLFMPKIKETFQGCQATAVHHNAGTNQEMHSQQQSRREGTNGECNPESKEGSRRELKRKKKCRRKGKTNATLKKNECKNLEKAK